MDLNRAHQPIIFDIRLERLRRHTHGHMAHPNPTCRGGWKSNTLFPTDRTDRTGSNIPYIYPYTPSRPQSKLKIRALQQHLRLYPWRQSHTPSSITHPRSYLFRQTHRNSNNNMKCFPFSAFAQSLLLLLLLWTTQMEVRGASVKLSTRQISHHNSLLVRFPYKRLRYNYTLHHHIAHTHTVGPYL